MDALINKEGEEIKPVDVLVPHWRLENEKRPDCSKKEGRYKEQRPTKDEGVVSDFLLPAYLGLTICLSRRYSNIVKNTKKSLKLRLVKMGICYLQQ